MDISILSSFDPFVLKMKVQKTGTVLDVKIAVVKANNTPIANQQLTLGRRILLDDDPLSLYKIKTGTMLRLEKDTHTSIISHPCTGLILHTHTRSHTTRF